jgi:hypothetical protein
MRYILLGWDAVFLIHATGTGGSYGAHTISDRVALNREAGRLNDLYFAQQYQNQHYQQHQSYAAGRTIAPLPAVGPGRNHTEQNQNQNNQNDHS